MTTYYRSISSVLIGMFFLANVFSQQINWKSDLEYIKETLPLKHYNLFFRKSENYFFQEINKIKEESENKTDFTIALDIQRLLATMGDSHTLLDYRPMLDREQILPLQTYWFSDGLIVLHTIKKNRDITGCRIISINGVSVEIIVDSLSRLMTVDNQAILKKDIPNLMNSVQVLRYFNLAKDSKIEFEYKNKNDEIRKVVIKPETINRNNIESFKPDSVAFCYKNQKRLFVENYFNNDKTYYLQYNKCWSQELEMQYGNKQKAVKLPSFKEFEYKVFETLKGEPVEKIIFDLRFNGGGNSRQGTDFITKLSEYLKIHPNVKLYVVLGRNTYSSAILNALDFKRLTNAIFVGEETSGKPNHFGELKTLLLPSSQLKLYYSTKYFEQVADDVNTLIPDVLIESSFENIIKGIDPVFDWIIKN